MNSVLFIEEILCHANELKAEANNVSEIFIFFWDNKKKQKNKNQTKIQSHPLSQLSPFYD